MLYQSTHSKKTSSINMFWQDPSTLRINMYLYISKAIPSSCSHLETFKCSYCRRGSFTLLLLWSYSLREREREAGVDGGVDHSSVSIVCAWHERWDEKPNKISSSVVILKSKREATLLMIACLMCKYIANSDESPREPLVNFNVSSPQPA